MNRYEAVLLLVLLAALVWAGWHWTVGSGAAARNRVRVMKWRIRMHRRPGPGWASAAELATHWSRLAAVHHGQRARPGMSRRQRILSPATLYAVRLGRAQWFKRVFARMEDQTLMMAPQRTGKTAAIADRIVTHPGPVLATTTRADLYELTAPYRSRLGPLWVFNPLGVGGLASTFAWDPLKGCEDPQVALLRAQDMTGWVKDSSDMSVWQDLAAVSLAALLHAATKVPDATMATVYGWMGRFDEVLATEALENDTETNGVFRTAHEQIKRQGRTADSIRTIMSDSVRWVAIPAAQRAVVRGAAGLDVRQFLAANGTLYLIAPGDEHSATAPLMRALAGDVHRTAALSGSWTPGGKLDPPLLMALDEVTQVCPLPLPRMLADSAGKGILIVAVVHSYGQMEEQWGRFGASTIWDTTGTKLVLGGVQNPETLEILSKLCGQVTIRRGDDKDVEVPVLPPALLRMLPAWWALALRMNRPPAVVRLRPIWSRRDFKRTRRAWHPAPAPAAPWLRGPLTLPLPRQAPENGNGHRTTDSERVEG